MWYDFFLSLSTHWGKIFLRLARFYGIYKLDVLWVFMALWMDVLVVVFAHKLRLLWGPGGLGNAVLMALIMAIYFVREVALFSSYWGCMVLVT